MYRLFSISLYLAALFPMPCLASEQGHFNPDTDPSRIQWTQLTKVLGPAHDARGQRFGIILKTMTNEYWRLMAAGYRKRAAADGVKLDIQAAQSESDPILQLAMMENMVGGQYRGILISPQSASNLQPAIDDAVMAKLPVVDVDGAVVDSVTQFVGPMNREMGVRVANWFIRHYPAGGQVAVIEGQAGVYSTVQRTAGFRDTIVATHKFQVVASVSGQWDRQKSFDVTLSLLRKIPNIIGIYCNNDTMALGVVDAVKSLHLRNKIEIFGNDGTRGAYSLIKSGDLAGTVDIFPMLTGEIGLDIAERVADGQSIPRVVETPQALVTRDNMMRYSGSVDTVRKALLEDAEMDQ